MDYKKAYKQALEMAREIHRNEYGKRFDMERLFPELKESEDERIRKDLIAIFKGEIPYTSEEDAKRYIVWLEKQGHKPTDKLEPKFKAGDWVVDNCGNVWKIEGILNQFYILECVEGGESRPTIEWVNKTFHLWTIKDAKDGDVLVYHNTATEIIMLFKSWVVDRVAAYTHFHIFDNDFRVNNSCDCGNGAHPATKEQRELLFQKMKEEGYEWDTDKKELKKIEPFEAEHGKYYYCIKDYFCGGRKQASKGDVVQALRGLPIMGLKDASEYFLPVNFIKCNSVWSEEDEKIYQSIIDDTVQENQLDDRQINWLKSIKQRIGG